MRKILISLVLILVQAAFAANDSLFELIKNENEAAILNYFDKNPSLNPNTKDKNDKSLLHHAVDADMETVAERLIAMGAEFTLDKRKRNVAFYAIENDNVALLDKFINKGIDPSYREQNGHDLCQYSVYQNSIKSFKYLDENGLCSIYYNDKRKNNHLTYAIKNKSPSIVKRILEIDSIAIGILDPFGNNLLLKAATADCAECFDMLLEKGLSADQENKSGLTIIDVLKYNRQEKYLQKVFQYKIDQEEKVENMFRGSSGAMLASTENTESAIEGLDADVAIENMNNGATTAPKCEDKYPIKKIVQVNIIETPYEVIIKTPVEVTYWATVKVTSTAVKTCWKSFEKVFNKCSLKKPWKCFDVTQIVRVPYDCSVKSVKDVYEKRIKTEFRDQVTNKVKRSIEKLEEYKRPLEYAACIAEKNLEDYSKAVGKSVQAVVDVHEAAFKLAKNDKEGAKKAFDRAKNKAKESIRHGGDVAESVGRVTYDVAGEVPVLFAATLSDKALGSHLVQSYEKRRDNISSEINKASQKAGIVLEASIQPENLGKIALVYAATTVGGPFGAAMANVLYDKIILKKDLSEKDMLKSFAIGAAAGYAAEGMQGLAEGQKAIDAYKHASYLSKIASGVTRNLVTDAGNVVLNNQSYTSKDLFKSLASGVSTVEVGNDAVAGIIESTLDGALQSVATQSIENNLDFSKIDFKEVEMALYQGLADGVTRESVHAIMDATLIKAIPESWKRADLKAIDAISDAFYEVLLSYEKYLQQERINFALQSLMVIDDQERVELINAMNKVDYDTKEEVARNVFGKSFKDLSAKEILSDDFNNQYQAKLIIAGNELIRSNKTFARIVELNGQFARNPASAAEILQQVGPATQTVLTVIATDASIPEPSDVVPAKWGALLLALGGAMIIDSVINDQDMSVREHTMTPPASDDSKGWELYNRALRGDKAAYYQYLNGADESSGTSIESKWSREPKSLQDKLTLEAALKHPKEAILIIESLNDPKFRGMEKWQYKTKSADGKDSVVHYVRDPKTGKLYDFKFKKHSE